MRSARTLFICNDGDYFLRHRRRVADALAESGEDVAVYAGGVPIAARCIGGKWTYAHVPVERFSFSPVGDFRLFATCLAAMLRRPARSVQLITLKPAVFGGLAAIVARLAGRGPDRIVVTIPGLGRLMSPTNQLAGPKASISRVAVNAAIRLLSRRRDVVFTFETEEDRREWIDRGLITAGNSLVLGGAGVDGRVFHPAVDPPAAHRPLRVLFAARLLRAKGLDVFLEAARRLEHCRDVEFIIAGMADPIDPDRFGADRLEAESSVVFLGEARSMPDLLRSVDVVCLPTRYGEGVPRILIEAAASGLATIASDAPGCGYIVKEGVSGTLMSGVSASDMTAALVKAVERYHDDPELLARHKKGALDVFREGPFEEAVVVDRIIALLRPA